MQPRPRNPSPRSRWCGYPCRPNKKPRRICRWALIRPFSQRLPKRMRTAQKPLGAKRPLCFPESVQISGPSPCSLPEWIGQTKCLNLIFTTKMVFRALSPGSQRVSFCVTHARECCWVQSRFCFLPKVFEPNRIADLQRPSTVDLKGISTKLKNGMGSLDEWMPGRCGLE